MFFLEKNDNGGMMTYGWKIWLTEFNPQLPRSWRQWILSSEFWKKIIWNFFGKKPHFLCWNCIFSDAGFCWSREETSELFFMLFEKKMTKRGMMTYGAKNMIDWIQPPTSTVMTTMNSEFWVLEKNNLTFFWKKTHFYAEIVFFQMLVSADGLDREKKQVSHLCFFWKKMTTGEWWRMVGKYDWPNSTPNFRGHDDNEFWVLSSGKK